MSATFNIDLTHFEATLALAEHEFAEDLHKAGLKAAKDGVELARASHRYTDRTGELTGEAHVEEDHATGGGIMTWPADYASYVDKGTSRAKAYPFTPKAKKLAAVMLNEGVQNAVSKFQRALSK